MLSGQKAARSVTIADACVALVVQNGVVYQDCDASGRWVTTKNTSECDLADSSLVSLQSYYYVITWLLHGYYRGLFSPFLKARVLHIIFTFSAGASTKKMT